MNPLFASSSAWLPRRYLYGKGPNVGTLQRGSARVRSSAHLH